MISIPDIAKFNIFNIGTGMSQALDELFQKHQTAIGNAIDAIHRRTFYAHWPEVPSGKIYGETAQSDGEQQFKDLLNAKFTSAGNDFVDTWHGAEESPYGFPLNVTYPVMPAQMVVDRAQYAFRPWASLTTGQRAGVLFEALERSSKHFYAIAFATMHTTGQGFVMAFQASGPHAYDRALEALALGYHEQTRFPDHALWEKPMGKTTVRLVKKFRAIGRGVSLAIGCSTFPVWNTLPSVFASLVTGNPVIVKPHPKAILPIAIVVADIRAVFSEFGIDPHTIQLAVDGENLVAKEYAENSSVKIIDYTGGSQFGEYLEGLKGKTVFTEKAGVNSVILDSVESLDPVLENLAFSLSLYSGQMCTTPQNIFLPRDGVRENGALIPYKEVVQRLADKINALTTNEKMGPGTLGAIQNPATLERIHVTKGLNCPVLLESRAVIQPGFAVSRSVSPILVEVPASRPDVLRKEMFGPIGFVVPTENTLESVRLAVEVSQKSGAITFAAYSTDPEVMATIEEELAFAGVPVSFNLTGPIWVNQSATYSDFHVTGGNPSGNASLVDPAFVARRFYTVGIRKPAE